jgi:hypothetical protein
VLVRSRGLMIRHISGCLGDHPCVLGER